jgi:hypothetical protein
MVNPHISAADVSLYNYNPRDEGYRVAQATLALAYEQRTANLIAWRSAGNNRTDEGPAIDKQIRGRLGLE